MSSRMSVAVGAFLEKDWSVEVDSRAAYRPVTVTARHITARDRRNFAANGHGFNFYEAQRVGSGEKTAVNG